MHTLKHKLSSTPVSDMCHFLKKKNPFPLTAPTRWANMVQTNTPQAMEEEAAQHEAFSSEDTL